MIYRINPLFTKLFLGIFLIFFISSSKEENAFVYDINYVQASSITHEGESYKVIAMKRTDHRVNAKYFAYKLNGQSVSTRYEKWAKDKDVILYTSGTYMDNSSGLWKLVGLAIDNGEIVNEKLQVGRMEGLVIVYPNGGIAVSNINEGNLKLSGGGVSTNRTYDLRKSEDLILFKRWAKSQRATVFQTHLLAWDNQLNFKYNYKSKPTKRERRFLAIGYAPNGDVMHYIVHKPDYYSLYDASKNILDFLKVRKKMNVIALLNLDTGMQNVCKVYTKSGNINNIVVGTTQVQDAENLLVYYFK